MHIFNFTSVSYPTKVSGLLTCEVRHVLKRFARTCTGATGALGELEPILLGQEALDFINKNLIWYSV